MGIRLSRDEIIDILDERNRNKRAKELAAWIGCCPQTVRNIRAIAGIGCGIKWTEDAEAKLINMWQSGLEVEVIAESFGTNKFNIFTRVSMLRKKGVELPKRKTRGNKRIIRTNANYY